MLPQQKLKKEREKFRNKEQQKYKDKKLQKETREKIQDGKQTLLTEFE